MTRISAGVFLTPAQQAAVAKLAFAVESPGAVALLCGPARVGKTLVLSQLAAGGPLRGRRCEHVTMRRAAGLGRAIPEAEVLIVDDAHEAGDGELAALFESWLSLNAPGGLVLAGEGRLLTLVAREGRIEQAAVLRAVLRPFTLAESTDVVAARCGAARPEFEAVVRAIHDIAAGIPGHVVRLAELVRVVADSAPGGRITADDVEMVHRRLCPQAA